MQSLARIPLWVKLCYTAFVVVMVPYYFRYWGPQNFLYFCDVAVLVTLVGIWWESALLISMQAIAILLPQIVWMIDFSGHFAGLRFFRMTDYMFDQSSPLLPRAISLFHGWLPILLVWLVYRLGYDRRAVVIQTVAGMVLLLICYFGFSPPGSHLTGKMAVNLNFVFGFSTSTPQTMMPPLAWLGMLLAGIPILIYFPTHLLLRAFIKPRDFPASRSVRLPR